MNDDEWLTIVGFLDIHTLSKSLVFIHEISHLFQQNSLWNSLIQRDFTQQQIHSVNTQTTSSNQLYQELYTIYKLLPYEYPASSEPKSEMKEDFLMTKIMLCSNSSPMMLQLTNMIVSGEWSDVDRSYCTIGIDFKTLRLLPLPDCDLVQRKIQIWITEEKFRTITTAYSRAARFVFCPYDPSDEYNSLSQSWSDGSLNSALLRAEEGKEYTLDTLIAVFLIAIHDSAQINVPVSDTDVKGRCLQMGYHFHSISKDTVRRDIRELVKLIIQMHKPGECSPPTVVTKPGTAMRSWNMQ